MSEHVFQRRRLTAAVTLTAVTVTWAVLVAPGSPGSAAAPTDGLQRVSVRTDGAQVDADSLQEAMSSDGTQIAFVSNGNLSPDQFTGYGANAYQSVFVRDTTTGKTVQLSVGESLLSSAAGPFVYTPNGNAPTGRSMHPSISANGRYVSFVTEYGSGVAGTAQGYSASLVVCDRDPDGNGVFDDVQPGTNYPNFRCVVVSSLVRTLDNMGASRPELDNAADRIAWSDGCSECPTDSYYVDLPRSSGQLIPPTTGKTTLPNSYVDGAGTTVSRNSIDEASLSGDGYHIVAVALDTVGSRRAIVKYDVPYFSGQTNPLVEIDASQTAGQYFNTATTHLQVDHPRLSDDGRYVVFDSPPSTADAVAEAWLVDTTPDNAAPLKSTLVSVGPDGSMVDGLFPAISGDGRYIAFLSDQTRAHNGQATEATFNTCLVSQRNHQLANSVQTPCQVVVRDRLLDAARAQAGLQPLPGHLASPSLLADCGVTPTASAPCVSAGASTWPLSLSQSGYRVAYNSYASDIVANDSNTSDYYQQVPAADVFVRTWLPTAKLTVPVFGNVRVGDYVEKFITLTTQGFGPIPVTNTNLTELGSSTSFTDNGYTCVPMTAGGTTCSVSISFAPLFPGPQSARVDIYTLGGTTPKYPVSISATGVRTPPAKLAPGDTTRTSVTTTGGQAGNGGGSSMISGNGRWDVFTSTSDLTGRPASVNSDYTVANVFVRDLANPQHTFQISLHGQPGTDATKPTKPHAETGYPTAPNPDGSSYAPSISDNGRFISFVTYATDIVPTDRFSSGTLVVCDRDPNGNGVFDEVQPKTKVPDYNCYAVDSATDSSGPSFSTGANTPRLSGDGTRIAWTQYTGQTQPGQWVRVADISTKGGPLHAPSILTPPLVLTTVPGFTNQSTMDPVLSQDGRRVVLVSQQYSPGNDLPPTAIVEVDLGIGTQTRLDRQPGTSAFIGDTGHVANPAMSSNGSVVAFEGSSGFQTGSVYVARLSGGSVTTFVGSRNNSGVDDTGFSPALSGDGRYLAFVTGAPNMHNGVDVPGTEGCGGTDGPAAIACQVVARDLTRDAARAAAGLSFLPGELVSASVKSDCGTKPANASCAGNQPSSDPSIDLIGSEIGFDSDANDLVAGDTNDNGSSYGTGDSFVHTWRPALTAAPVAFGNVVVGASSSRSFNLTATGFGPVAISSLQTSGPNAGDFTVPTSTCTGAVLHAKVASDPGTGNGCLSTVTFTPSALGARTGSLSVGAGPNTYPVINPLAIRALTGTGTRKSTVPQIGLNPTGLNFGSDIPLHLPGKKKTITVSNPGGGTLTITGVTVTDTTVPGAKNDYTVDTSNCSGGVPAGGTCTITVTFIGHAVGPRPGIIVITDNASGGPVQISVTANVPKPLITVNPAVTPTGRVVTVSGVGFAPNTTVAISFATTVEQAEATVDAKGTFSAPLVIFPNADQGPRTIKAATLLADPSISATTPLLVALGTLESPTLVNRH